MAGLEFDRRVIEFFNPLPAFRGQLSPPPERFWVGTVETFERSNCHTLPNAVMFSGYQVSWLKPRF